MRVKKFSAPTIKEALVKVRSEFGDGALIISTRDVVSALGRKQVEVTAAAQDPAAPAAGAADKLTPDGLEEQIVKNRVLLSQSLKPLAQELFEIRSMVDRMRREASERDALEPLRAEVRELKRMFGALTRGGVLAEKMDFARPLQDAYQQLLAGELDESLGYRLVEVLDSKLTAEEKADPAVVRAHLRAMLSRLVTTAKPIALNHARPTVLAFIGPTGVGKTTTIAKLAARCSLQMKRKVTLITIDTFRIAAVEQLKTYARIMDLPIFVCYSPQEMERALKDNFDSALILIDTAGRSPTDEEQVRDLRSCFAGRPEIEVMLVLSATTKDSDLRDITTRFEQVNPRKLVFTKLDETTTYGPILNEAVRTKLPLAYVTTGQNVPDDIEAADPGKLVGFLLGEKEEALD